MQASPDTAPTRADLCHCLAVRQAARQITQLYDSSLESAGLRTTQYSVLSHLARLGPSPINVLAAHLVTDRTTMGRALQPLEREGLVKVEAGEDKRLRLLTLTAAGRRRLAKAIPLWRRAQDAFEKSYGVQDAGALRTALKKVAAAR